MAERRAGVVDRHDVRVRRDTAGGQALGAETPELTVVESVRAQHLERDRPVEAGIAGTVDGGETALVDPFQVLVALRSVTLPLGRLRVRPVDQH
jgi:hypothetical protein